MEEIGDEVIKEIIEIENPNNDNVLSCIKIISLNVLLVLFCISKCYINKTPPQNKT